MNRSTTSKYLAAVAAVILATAVRMLLDPVLEDHKPLSTYLVAVVFSAWYGGVGPGLTALVLGAVTATYFFIPPRYSLLLPGADSQLSLGMYFVVAVVTALLSGSLRSAQRLGAAVAAEASIRSELLRVTLSGIADGVISTDAQGAVVFLNPTAQMLTGWPLEQAMGRPLADVYRVQDEVTRLEIAAFFAYGQECPPPPTINRQTTLVARDGSRSIVEHSLSPIHEGIDRSNGAVILFRDVSRQKRDEEVFKFLARSSIVLSESLDLKDTLAKVARLPIATLADWCLVDVIDDPQDPSSPHTLVAAHRDRDSETLLEEICRTTRGPSPGLNLDALAMTRAVWVDKVTDDLLRRTASNERSLAALRQLRPRSWITAPLLVNERNLGTIWFAVTETVRRYAEADVAWAEDYARRAATAIENARLYGDSRLASRRKDEFLATLSHELRNPLQVLRAGLHIMQTAPSSDGDQRQNLETMGQQLEQLVRLVDDLLDVSRISRGKIILRKEPIDLGELLRRVVVACRPMIDARGCELLVELGDAPVVIEADPIRIHQVVINLLSNAVKCTAVGGRIWLTCEARADEVQIRVRDNGIGIEPEMLTRIFDLFTQIVPAGEQSPRGMGIGLTVVRDLIEMHGGVVDAASAGLGQGSEFVVRLPSPQVEREASEGHHDGLRDHGEPLAPRPATGLRVLVVDDNASSVRSLTALLRCWGYTTECTADPFTAPQIADWFEPEVVLLDIGMPCLSGLELGKQLRARLPEVRLVAITGHGQEEDRQRSLENGFECHFVKPVDPLELAQFLATVRPTAI